MTDLLNIILDDYFMTIRLYNQV